MENLTVVRRVLAPLLSVLAIALTPAVALAAPGDLDLSFSGDGRVLTDLNAGSDDVARAATVDDRGRLLIAGDSRRPPQPPRLALTRYLPGGALDPSFGAGGIVILPLPRGMVAEDVAIDRVGRIVVAGHDGRDAPRVVRLLPNGQPDPSFGANGVVEPPFAFLVRALTIDEEGRVLVAGGAVVERARTRVHSGVFRLLEDGSLDGSFSFQGLVFNNAGTAGHDVAEDVLVDHFGRIVLAGGAWLPEPGLKRNVGRFAIMRLHPNGALDDSFRGDGIARIQMNRRGSFATSAALDGPGNTILAGRAAPQAGFAKVRGAGLLGKTYGDAGRLKLGVQGKIWPVDLAIDRFGRQLAAIAAPSLSAPGAGQLIGVRLSSRGRPDRSFSQDSRVNTGFGRWAVNASSIALYGGGQIAIAGTARRDDANHRDFAAARYLPAGAALVRCRNPEGFSIGFPRDWEVNKAEAGVPRCSQFDPEPVELEPDTDARFAAITAAVESVDFETAAGSREGRSTKREETTIDGRPAVRLSAEASGEGLYPLGTPVTLYAVDLPPDGDGAPRTLLLDTVGLSGFDYERNVRVLDRMAESVDLAL